MRCETLSHLEEPRQPIGGAQQGADRGSAEAGAARSRPCARDRKRNRAARRPFRARNAASDMAAERARRGVPAVDCAVDRGGRPANVLAPLRLDVGEQPWPIASAAAVLSLNMIHIAPWAAGTALISWSSRHSRARRRAFLYGPFRRENAHTSPSNEAFDRQLRTQTQLGACAIWRRLRATRRRPGRGH